MKLIAFILLLLLSCKSVAQSFTFNRFTTEDGIGLSSNVVKSIYQDEKGFIWVGTANGLQRFDGRKFIQFITTRPGSDRLPNAMLHQILPADQGRLLLSFTAIREFGIFDPATFTYTKISLPTGQEIPEGAGFYAWGDAANQLYLTISSYGILMLDKKKSAFVDSNPFKIPRGWRVSSTGVYEDTLHKQVWICADSGLMVYDQGKKQLYSRNKNPLQLALLENEQVQDGVSTIFIDRERRTWMVGKPAVPGEVEYQYCLDSTGTRYLQKDTAGLTTGPVGFSSYHHFYETRNGNLWVYGKRVLFNYNKGLGRFQFHKSGSGNDNININYEDVYQVMEDKDGGIWIATDQGLYFTSLGNNDYSVVNLILDNKKSSTYITDLLEMPNGDFCFTSWGVGVK